MSCSVGARHGGFTERGHVASGLRGGCPCPHRRHRRVRPSHRILPGTHASSNATSQAEGLRYHVRPIRPDDGPRLVELHGRLSRRSVYLRFFGPHPTLSDAEVKRFTEVDYEGRLALVATIGDDLIAVVRYDRTPGTSEAEVAFVVDDKYQHHGTGIRIARRAGRCGVGPRGDHVHGRDAGREPDHARRVPPRRFPRAIGHRIRHGDAALPDRLHCDLDRRPGGATSADRGRPSERPRGGRPLWGDGARRWAAASRAPGAGARRDGRCRGAGKRRRRGRVARRRGGAARGADAGALAVLPRGARGLLCERGRAHRRRHLRTGRLVGGGPSCRGRRPRRSRRARPARRRRGLRAGSPTRSPRAGRARHGLLPVEQRRRRGRVARRLVGSGCSSWTGTCTTATARRRSSGTIPTCCTSPPISTRSIRAPDAPARSAGRTPRD